MLHKATQHPGFLGCQCGAGCRGPGRLGVSAVPEHVLEKWLPSTNHQSRSVIIRGIVGKQQEVCSMGEGHVGSRQ